MSIISIPAPAWERGLEPTEIGWHGIVHVLGCAGVARFILVPNCYTALLTAILFLLGHLSIRTGAHSLYTHRAYEAALVWHLYKIGCFFLTMQGSMSEWVRLHVRHHKFTDQPEDPYSPAHGFLWSHMLWRCFKLPAFNDAREAIWLVRGATRQEKCVVRLIAWQQRWSWSGGLLAAIALPTALASLWGDAWGGLLVTGFFRLLCQYHLTWQINSLGHTVGPDLTRPTRLATHRGGSRRLRACYQLVKQQDIIVTIGFRAILASAIARTTTMPENGNCTGHGLFRASCALSGCRRWSGTCISTVMTVHFGCSIKFAELLLPAYESKS
jgi:fatty-acid desaturase